MTESAGAGYSSDWVGEAGLALDEGYCITLVRGVEPREALHRLGVDGAALRTATWPEFAVELRAQAPARFVIGVAAAFGLGEHVVLVEDLGYRGRLPEWAGPVSRGTEAVNVYLSPTSLKEELTVYRDGGKAAFIDGDEPEVVEGGDGELAGRLIELTYDALKPWTEDDPAPADFGDGRVDLLQVACDYLGLEPRVPDISGPVLGAIVEYRA
ncbi:hypothetical protein FHX82_005633 [Amycolatopsis bartoniae]|uniref:Uncharacterized protein n=1 Tax=Amycolatopsis bartoniae TaxID=941986 RepID=A0A8H9J0Q8_9PSEU|nr:DUF6461 domain-containing protein [Amycolatopsis bartoniae]MBB2938555.1 hypothetical protein [Amycolatopsis bartoniae]TVT10306.1 hypothetical protein FNH07_05265 [Amycolatopsis bartoniae]GHF70178.1 hypothetical protein GCM10017566_49900 [Amycolatopsis bartoniae]